MTSTSVTANNWSLSDSNSHQVSIEVTRGSSSALTRPGISRITIPYSCLSQTMQRIHRLGGRVTGVTIPQTQAEVLTVASSPAPQAQSSTARNIREQTKPTDDSQGQQSRQKPKS
jgi:CpcD/allophycocyanin linker domain